MGQTGVVLVQSAREVKTPLNKRHYEVVKSTDDFVPLFNLGVQRGILPSQEAVLLGDGVQHDPYHLGSYNWCDLDQSYMIKRWTWPHTGQLGQIEVSGELGFHGISDLFVVTMISFSTIQRTAPDSTTLYPLCVLVLRNDWGLPPRLYVHKTRSPSMASPLRVSVRAVNCDL